MKRETGWPARTWRGERAERRKADFAPATIGEPLSRPLVYSWKTDFINLSEYGVNNLPEKK
jgi:hypothetical protein